QLPGEFTDGVALAQDDAGTLYASDTDGSFIAVASSKNGGATWTTVENYVAGASAIADRPWLAARGDGEVTLVWNAGQVEMCSRSTDGGVTFTQASPYGS